MTVLSMPKNQVVTVHQNNFSAFLQHIIRTLEDHLQYTEHDSVTETAWNDFKCNGIMEESLQNIESVAHLLQITDTTQMTLGNVIVQLFESLKVLRHYYAITKVNEKSVKIRRLVINDMKKFFEDLHQDAHPKVLPTAFDKSKQTMLTDLFLKKSPVDNDAIEQQPSDEEVDTNESQTQDIDQAKDKPNEETPSDVTSEPKQQGLVTSDNRDETEGFQHPKKTFKLMETEANDASTTNDSGRNTNSYQLLDETDDNEQNEEDPDEDISYESSNHPSTVLILTKVMKMAKKLSEDDDEIEIFAKWIESDVAPMMNESARSVYQQAQQKAQDLMRVNTDKYIRKRIHELTDKIKSTAEQSQVNVMSHINGQATMVMDTQRQSLKDVMQEVTKLKTLNEQYKEEYTKDLERIRQDFQKQTKEYLEDHLLHRRTIFTNQKASFDKDFKQMRAEMDNYIAKMYAVKTTLEDEVESLQKQLTIHTTSNLMFKEPKPATSPSFAEPNKDTVRSNPSNLADDDKAFYPDTQKPSSRQPYSYDYDMSHPFPQDTFVTVENPYIYIAKAQVHRSRQLPDGTYEYDIFTKTSRYTYHQDYIRLFTDLQEAEPPKEQSTSTNKQFAHDSTKNTASSTHPSKPSTVEIDNKHQSNQRFTQQNRVPYDTNNRYCQPCSVDTNQADDDDDVVFLRTNKPLMPNQFQIIGQPKEVKIDSQNMLRFAKDWNISWTDCTEDPREFYEVLRIRMEAYGVFIKPYLQLSKDEDIAVINENNCRNYKNAHSEISKSIFSIMYTNKDDWFGSNPKVDLLNYYLKERDGLGFLKEILVDSHPNLMKITKTQTMDKPRLRQYSTWFGFMNDYRKFIDFEQLSPAKRIYTDEEHLSNILKEISDIEGFAAAKQHLEQEMLLLEKKNAVFPDELKLNKVALTIYNLIPTATRNALPDFSQMDATTAPTIHKMNRVQNPYNKPRSAMRRKDTTPPSRDNDITDSGIKFNPSSRKFEDVICSACGQAGHDIHIHGCDQTAMMEKIQAYKRKTKNNFDAKTVVDIFDEYQQQRRKKRISGKSARNTSRRRLRAAKLEMDPEEFAEAKGLYINKFQEMNPDVDMDDPRQDHNMEIKPYDILDSEDENDDDI